MVRDLLDKLRDYVYDMLSELRIFYFLFKKEGVFKYFFVIFLLMLVSGFAFMLLEQERLLAAIPADSDPSLLEKLISAFYWAIVTVATCGYGDISPGTAAGRVMVIVVLYLSVTAVSLFTANLASALTTKKMMEKRGIMNIGEMKDHFIICGWKNAMSTILSEIIFTNPKLSLKKVVIIANIEPNILELFHQQYPEYVDIAVLRGEHYNETLLRKVNVQRANKVLIIADESIPTATATEVDSKTVMTAMAIRAISMGTRVTAELLDVKFEKYLKNAHVEEIIYTNEYSKVLIANSFTKVGVTKIVNELLNVHTASFIITKPIPHEYLGNPFVNLRDHYKRSENSLLIGLLENVGGYIERKEEALREAQKTPDVNKLIMNLKSAKKIENNLPNINPTDEYLIPHNSMAILVVKQDE